MIKTYEHKCFRDVLKAALYLDDLALGRGMQEQKQAVLHTRHFDQKVSRRSLSSYAFQKLV